MNVSDLSARDRHHGACENGEEETILDGLHGLADRGRRLDPGFAFDYGCTGTIGVRTIETCSPCQLLTNAKP